MILVISVAGIGCVSVPGWAVIGVASLLAAPRIAEKAARSGSGSDR